MDDVIAEIQEFVTGERPAPSVDRVLATVLFTDIVGSTRLATELGDAGWKALIAAHETRARAEIERHRGRVVDTAGDGVFATFDGPARAVRCALAIGDAVKPLGVALRAGAHVGEVELTGDQVSGIAVHVGARIAALAGSGEVWVSSTVKDLTLGSGLVFEDAGERELKGVPERWRLYRVAGS
jgi:class 3 adenylate cyclase